MMDDFLVNTGLKISDESGGDGIDIYYGEYVWEIWQVMAVHSSVASLSLSVDI